MEASASRFAVELDAVHGGRISSLRLDGVELLVTDRSEGPKSWGSYPMVPWAGRLAHGKLVVDDSVHQFPIDHEVHAIHGTLYDRAWTAGGALEVAADLDPPWPFGGRATHRAEVGPDRVRFELEVHAVENMPIQVGWHPWFRRDLGVGEPLAYRVAPGAMYEIDAEAIPTGTLLRPPPPPPWDNCFTDLAMPPRIEWPGFAEIELRSSADHWVIYDMPTHAVCIEPQTGPPNQLNTDPVLIGPGDRFVAWFEIVAA